MKKNDKFIAIASFIFSIIGILGAVYSFYMVYNKIYQFENQNISRFFNIILLLETLNLNFTNQFDHLDIWNFIFYVLLFIGAIQFYKTQGKETRLIGFVFSVIFMNGIIWLIYSIFYKIFIMNWKDADVFKMIQVFLGFIILLSSIFISYKILKIIKNQKEIDIIKTETKTTIVDTGKWQRAFHWLIDLTVMSLILIPLLITLVYWFANTDILQNSSGLQVFFRSRLSLYVIIFIFFFIYYPISEILFGSSPAKFLTESRLINTKAQHPSASTIFTRTLCRNIPFDAISFLGKRGWHDSLSETYVVKEKRTGFKTNKLLWILPILAIYLLIMYIGRPFLEGLF